jgi:hypothetical protein
MIYYKTERKFNQNQRGCVRWMDIVREKAEPERECCRKDHLTTLVMACSEKAKLEIETKTR